MIYSALIVDDVPIVGTQIRAILAELMVSGTVQASAFEALERAGSHRYDIIICDIHMPDMNGIQFFRELSRRFPNNGAAKFICSGDRTAETVLQARSLGLDGYISKPIDATLMRNKVMSAMAAKYGAPQGADGLMATTPREKAQASSSSPLAPARKADTPNVHSKPKSSLFSGLKFGRSKQSAGSLKS